MESVMKCKYISVEDIALIEHELITESEILEWKPEDAVWYLSGIHEMAQKVIDKISEKEGE